MKKYLIIIFIFVCFFAFSQEKIILDTITTKSKGSVFKIHLKGSKKRSYKAIVFETKNNSIKISKIKLVFEDGEKSYQDIEISAEKNNKLLKIDKKGNDILEKITIYIRSYEDVTDMTELNIYGIVK
ncbi:MAG: hypothetical protein A2086_01380 [Spirochaetes bacterium GWD1_27_9]|nr:MAG: hypothetical protein A2Z98_13295 [Spirochaetes bacterium GWB1_27_13]OHD24426.1 MAG: hypothetical protein A2Y34_04245 [Spirochaetes bacterium GWC1_27_15]OHD36927.1 MAG: hypothetical protein A2086_01380 [Spirochaetes bacterium GWD1_27_9]